MLGPETSKRVCKKCGITTKTDGSEKDSVSIGHLPDYQMPTDFDDKYAVEDDQILRPRGRGGRGGLR